MESVHVCLPVNHGLMLCKFSLPVSRPMRSSAEILLLSHSFLLGVLQSGALPGHPVDSSDTWTIFLSFVFHSRTILHLLQWSSDYFNHLIYRRMHLFFKNSVTYKLQNMLVGTYPVAEHYRDCGKDLDCDS